MYKVDLPVDQSMAKAVDRRRSAEAARKARVYNTRLRVMGLDIAALDQQVQEKKLNQNMEMKRDKAFDHLRELHDDIQLRQEIDERREQTALHTDLTHFWAHQCAEGSREADLKVGLKGAFRNTIPENELGPASMQIFQGEGIGEEQKRREQMKKTERDLREQKEDNEKRRVGDKYREMLVRNKLVYQDLRGVQQHIVEEECKKAARVALDSYNQALAEDQAERVKEQQRREEEDNLLEKMHTLTSDMMTECAAQREEGGARPRVQTDRWKGMSAEQLSAIHRGREGQRQERQRQRVAEKAHDVACELHFLKVSREAQSKECRAEELRRERRIQMDQYNKQLATTQRENQEYLTKELYTNKPTKDYFNQFNSSSR